MAGPAILAGFFGTIVNVLVAVFPFPTGLTTTAIAVHRIGADAVFTRVGLTVVDIRLALFTGVTGCTFTGVCVDAIFTGPAVKTRVVFAFVDIDVTGLTREARGAVTNVGVHTIRAAPSILTGVGCCLLYTSPSPRDRTRSRMPSSA